MNLWSICKRRILLLAGFSAVLLLISFPGNGQKSNAQDKNSESMLCVGNYWTEAEGKAFLEKERKEYTTAEAWKKRAKEIRAHILKGAGLETFPKKCPLNPVFGEKRVHDGYQVQNVAFESLPGVFVTGSLYTPLNAKGKIPGYIEHAWALVRS